MKTQTSAAITGALLALCVMAGSSAFAENQAAEDPMAEAQAFLASPTGLGQAIATAELARIMSARISKPNPPINSNL